MTPPLEANIRTLHRDDLKALLKEAAQEGVRDFLEELGIKREDAHMLRAAVEFQKTLDRTKGEIGREVAKAMAKALIWIFALGLIAAGAKALGLGVPAWLVAAAPAKP